MSLRKTMLILSAFALIGIPAIADLQGCLQGCHNGYVDALRGCAAVKQNPEAFKRCRSNASTARTNCRKNCQLNQTTLIRESGFLNSEEFPDSPRGEVFAITVPVQMSLYANVFGSEDFNGEKVVHVRVTLNNTVVLDDPHFDQTTMAAIPVTLIAGVNQLAIETDTPQGGYVEVSFDPVPLH